MKLILIVFAVLSSALASQRWTEFRGYEQAQEVGENGCCAPNQWEASVGSLSLQKSHSKPKATVSESRVAFDFSGKKVAANTTVACKRSGRISHVRSISDFGAKKGYFIFNNTCKVFKLETELQRVCIPSSFKKLGRFSFGIGSDSLVAQSFGLRNKSLDVLVATAERSCFPISSRVRVSRKHKTSLMGQQTFFNAVAGIKDRGIFEIPDYCGEEVEEENEEAKPKTVWGRAKKWWRRRGEVKKAEWKLQGLQGHPTFFIHQLIDESIQYMKESKTKSFGRRRRHYKGGRKMKKEWRRERKTRPRYEEKN